MVSVPPQVSVIVHLVPRALADELRPRVRKCPFTFENSVRLRFFGAPPGGSRRLHLPRPPPRIESVVRGFLRVCAGVNIAPRNSPCWSGLPVPAEVSSATVPLVVSKIDPSGTCAPAASVTNLREPLRLTRTFPLTTLALIVFPIVGAGSARGPTVIACTCFGD